MIDIRFASLRPWHRLGYYVFDNHLFAEREKRLSQEFMREERSWPAGEFTPAPWYSAYCDGICAAAADYQLKAHSARHSVPIPTH